MIIRLTCSVVPLVRHGCGGSGSSEYAPFPFSTIVLETRGVVGETSSLKIHMIISNRTRKWHILTSVGNLKVSNLLSFLLFDYRAG